ncbi:MAG: hypothetical protein WD768_06075 [Phycisphaeraceae bacterium]
MRKAMIIKGTLTGPRHVELAEVAPGGGGEVDVIIHGAGANGSGPRRLLSEVLETLPVCGRTKDEVDRQLDDDRNSSYLL